MEDVQMRFDILVINIMLALVILVCGVGFVGIMTESYSISVTEKEAVWENYTESHAQQTIANATSEFEGSKTSLTGEFSIEDTVEDSLFKSAWSAITGIPRKIGLGISLLSDIGNYLGVPVIIQQTFMLIILITVFAMMIYMYLRFQPQ